LNKQFIVMQTTHSQQPDHILRFKATHNIQHVGVTRKSNMRSIHYSLILTRSEQMIINI